MSSKQHRDSIILTILGVLLALLLISRTHTARTRTARPSRTTPDTNLTPMEARCVIYDRPPRTGSTTISRALEKCFRSKGYFITPFQRLSTRGDVIDIMLNSSHTLRATLRSHLYMSMKQVTALREQCGHILYMSSASPMQNRLRSYVKYTLTSWHGNSTVSAEDMFTNWNVTELEEKETFLEDYPYIGNDVSEFDRLYPDYVIRQDRLEDDMAQLMRALGCQHVPVISGNIHSLFEESDEDEDFSREETGTGVSDDDLSANFSAVMRHKDFRYEQLTQVANMGNEDGLETVTLF